MTDDTPADGRQTAKLTSWKRIARYLQCGERTARRWRDEEGLPVHSNGATAQSSVFAYAQDLDHWLEARATATTPASAASPAETAAKTGRVSGRPPIWVMGLAAAGVTALALLGFLSLVSPTPWAPKSDDAAHSRTSVAVLSFENLAPQDVSDDKTHVFEENLRAALAAHNIKIIVGDAQNEKVKAGFVISGAFQNGGSQENGGGAAITVKIIDQTKRAVLWAGGVTDSTGDFDAVQTQALAHVVGVLSCTLDFQKSDPALLDAALGNLARFCEANLRQELRANSMFYAEEVLAAAPESATANGLMGASLGLSANWTDRLVGDERIDARTRAKAYVEKAIAIDASNSVAKIAGVFSEYPPQNWALIEQRFLDALSEDHSEYIASLMYARFLSKVGRTNEAIHAYRKTLSREPLDVLSINARVEYASLLALTGDIENARLHYDRAIAENPGWTQAHDEYLMSELFYGDKQRVQDMLNGASGDAWYSANQKTCYLSFIAARGSLQISRRNTLPTDEELPFGLAEKCRDVGVTEVRLFAALGNVDAAFEAINAQSDSAEVMGWSFGPEIDAMRHDIRYWEAAEKAGLVSYWRNAGKLPDFCRGYSNPPAVCEELKKEI